MKNIGLFFVLAIVATMLFSCKKNDPVTQVKLKLIVKSATVYPDSLFRFTYQKMNGQYINLDLSNSKQYVDSTMVDATTQYVDVNWTNVSYLGTLTQTSGAELTSFRNASQITVQSVNWSTPAQTSTDFVNALNCDLTNSVPFKILVAPIIIK
jgi:hypothetical protein